MRMSTRNTARVRKRWLLFALPALAALLVLPFAAGYLLNTGRLRPELEARLAAYFGMPAQIEALGVSLFPRPTVALYGVRLGEAPVYAHVETCDVHIDARGLLRREIRITHAHARNVRVALPPSPAEAAHQLDVLFEALRAHWNERAAASQGAATITVDLVVARPVHILLGDVVIAEGEARAEHVSSPVIEAAMTAHLPFLGAAARATTTVTFHRRAGQPLSVVGEAGLRMEHIHQSPHASAPFHIAAEVYADFAGARLDDIGAQIAGDTTITHGDAVAQGVFSARAWWRDAAFIINDLHGQLPGFAFMADATFPVRGDAPALRIHQAALAAPLLQPVLDVLSPPNMRLAASETAVLSVADLLTGVSVASVPRLASGSVSVSGVTVLNQDNAPVVDHARLEADVVEGRLFIRELTGGGWRAEGWLLPDEKTNSIGFELQAAGPLDRQRLRLALPALPETLEEVSGTLDLTGITGTYSLDKRAFVAARCAGRLSGSRLTWRLKGVAAPLSFCDYAVVFHYLDDGIHIEEARFGRSVFQGKARLGTANTPLHFDLSGLVHLADAPPQVFQGLMPFSNLDGQVEASALTLTFHGDGTPEMVFNGLLHNGSGIIQADGYQDRISAASGALQLEKGSAHVTVTCHSERLGALRGEGMYTLDTGHIAGEVVVDAGIVAGGLLPDGPWRVPVAGMAAAVYGQTGLSVGVQLPGAVADIGSVELRRQQEPAFHFQGTLYQQDGSGVQLRDRLIQADVPLPVIIKQVNLHRESMGYPLLPLEMEGMAQLRYEQESGQGPYRLMVDASAARVQLTPWLHKPPGVPLRVTMQGAAQQGMVMEALVDNQTITVINDGSGNYQGRDVIIALETLERLILPDIRLRGEAALSFNTLPFSMEAQLRDAAVALAPEVSLGLLTGTILYNAGTLQFRQMQLRGGDFDCRLDTTRDGNGWRGILEGARVDGNRLREISEALAQLRGLESPGETGMTMPDATGTLQLRIGELVYRRGALHQVVGTAQITPEIITVEDFACRIGQGAATGRVRIQPEHAGTSKPAAVYVKLDMDGVDMERVEKLLFTEPRDLAGHAYGSVEAQLPTGREGFRRMDGKFQLQLRDGSLGRLGFATQLSTVLRNMEFVRLRAPSLQDAGLTYNAAIVNIVMRDGLAQINNCTATSPSYSVEAVGRVDFARMQSDVQVGVSIFDGVTGLVERVPIIGPTATSVMREATRIRLRATGDPFDIRWTPDVLP